MAAGHSHEGWTRERDRGAGPTGRLAPSPSSPSLPLWPRTADSKRALGTVKAETWDSEGRNLG